MNKPIRQVWTFRSDSNPGVEYQTLLYTDGTTSCACKGWTRRVAADGSRTCKHSRWVDMGMADRYCTATHRYENHNQQPQTNYAQIKPTAVLGRRKFAFQ